MMKSAILFVLLTAGSLAYAGETRAAQLAENAGDEVGAAADKTAAETNKAGRKVKRATKKAIKKTGEAVEKTGDKIQGAAK